MSRAAKYGSLGSGLTEDGEVTEDVEVDGRALDDAEDVEDGEEEGIPEAPQNRCWLRATSGAHAPSEIR